MNLIVTQNQINRLYPIVQGVVDGALNTIREESEDWGLGEMDELYEIDSIEKILVDKIIVEDKFVIYLDIYTNRTRDEFDNTVAEVEYHIRKWLPNSSVELNEIVNDWSMYDKEI